MFEAGRGAAGMDIKWTLRERVLDLWAEGLTDSEIVEIEGVSPTCIKRVLQRARLRDDPRAHYRGPSDYDFDQPRAEADASHVASKVEPEVTLPTVQWRGDRESLRPLRMSVERAREAPRQTNVTAVLMGDPPPERSALGRECMPHEYASGSGEGRHRGREGDIYAHHASRQSRATRVRAGDYGRARASW